MFSADRWELSPKDLPTVAAFPFVFIDQIIDQGQRRIQVVKNVSQNEWGLISTAKGERFFPESLLLEIMAQAAAKLDELLHPGKTFLTRIPHLEFYRPIRPGDQILATAEQIKKLDLLVAYQVQAEIEKQLVAKGDMFFSRMSIPGPR